MRTFSKSKLMALCQCSKRLWLKIYDPELRIDSAFSMKQIFRKKLGGQHISLRLITMIQSSELGPHGKVGDAIGDIVFIKGEFKEILINLGANFAKSISSIKLKNSGHHPS